MKYLYVDSMIGIEWESLQRKIKSIILGGKNFKRGGVINEILKKCSIPSEKICIRVNELCGVAMSLPSLQGLQHTCN